MKSCIKKCIITLIILLFSLSAKADVVWPSLYIAGGMCTLKVIIAGLFVELFFVKFFTKANWLKSCITTIAMNCTTTLLGIILIPLTGLLLELIISFSPTFHWSHWLLSYISVIIINTCIEGFIVQLILHLKFKKNFWWLFIANAISVLMCILFCGITMNNIKL